MENNNSKNSSSPEFLEEVFSFRDSLKEFTVYLAAILEKINPALKRADEGFAFNSNYLKIIKTEINSIKRSLGVLKVVHSTISILGNTEKKGDNEI
jgi:hypothetical protein